jgi:hypothetical protein
MESNDSQVSETAAIDDMVTDQLNEVPSAVSDTEAAPVQAADTQDAAPATSAEPQATQAGAEELTAPVSQEPTPTFRIGDREYTAQEIQAAFTTAQQFPVIQNKYVGALEQLKQAQQQPQQQGQQQPQMSAQQWTQAIRAKYDPVVNQLSKDGVIEQDAVTLFPSLMAQAVAYKERQDRHEQVLNSVVEQMQGSQRQAQSSGLVNDIGRSINALAQSGDAFAPLRDPAKVQQFFNYLYDMNPQVHQMRNPDFLARQWVAYNKDQYLQEAQARMVAQNKAEQTRYARADATTGTRAPGQMSEPAKTPLDSMADDFFDRAGL